MLDERLEEKRDIEKIKKIKKEMGNNLIILAHHYQRSDIVDLADADNPELGAYIDLAALLNEDEESCEYHNDAPFMNTPLFSFETVTNLMLKYHLHPITVHFPNGVIPVAVALIFLAAIF